MHKRAVIFDLDGTLLDTLEDIAAAGNYFLESLKLPTHPVQAYRQWVGDGADKLVQRALPDDQQARAPEALKLFRQYYAEHPSDDVRIYDGMAELLDELTERSVPMAVLSNKPDDTAKQVVSLMLGRWKWAAVSGQREDTPRKPDPAAAVAIAEKVGVPPACCLFLGDMHVDMHTAANAGMIGVGALWGFRSRDELIAAGARHVIEHPLQLLDLLN